MSDSVSEARAGSFLRRLLRGPSILDLTVSMALIAVISAIAIPTFFSQPQVTLDHAAILLANDLRYTQNEAAISGETTRIVFDGAGDGYSATYRSGAAIANPVGGADLVRQYSFDAIFRGVHLETRDGVEQVEFDRGGFALNDAEIHLYYEDGTRVLRMEKGSGLVEISGLESQWKDDGL